MVEDEVISSSPSRHLIYFAGVMPVRLVVDGLRTGHIAFMDETRTDFWKAQNSKVSGFPTPVVVKDGTILAVTIGYSH